MKLLILFVFLSTSCVALFGNDFRQCELHFKDGTVQSGFAAAPEMNDNYVQFRPEIELAGKRVLSDDLEKIVFSDEGGHIYKRVRTYKNYGNKKINKSDSWLELLKSGCVSFYYGYQTGTTTPSMKLWYYKKSTDEVAYFITMKYSGGPVMTLGNQDTFKKNASKYLKDHPELASDILSKKYSGRDMGVVVDIYNNWCEE